MGNVRDVAFIVVTWSFLLTGSVTRADMVPQGERPIKVSYTVEAPRELAGYAIFAISEMNGTPLRIEPGKSFAPGYRMGRELYLARAAFLDAFTKKTMSREELARQPDVFVSPPVFLLDRSVPLEDPVEATHVDIRVDSVKDHAAKVSPLRIVYTYANGKSESKPYPSPFIPPPAQTQDLGRGLFLSLFILGTGILVRRRNG